MFCVYNHNWTFLGAFATESEAIKESKYYTEQTGNPSYWEFTEWENQA